MKHELFIMFNSFYMLYIHIKSTLCSLFNQSSDKKLFNEHRKMQLSAVKSMQRFGNQEAQFKLVNVMLTQLFKVLFSSS